MTSEISCSAAAIKPCSMPLGVVLGSRDQLRLALKPIAPSTAVLFAIKPSALAFAVVTTIEFPVPNIEDIAAGKVWSASVWAVDWALLISAWLTCAK